jgi:hypothetical protein
VRGRRRLCMGGTLGRRRGPPLHPPTAGSTAPCHFPYAAPRRAPSAARTSPTSTSRRLASATLRNPYPGRSWS